MAGMELRRYSETLWAYALIAPLIVGVLIFFYGGMIYSLVISFTNYNPITKSGSFIGAGNYLRALTDPLLRRSIVNTILYVVISVPLLILISAFLAILISEQRNKRFKGALKFLFFLPNITLPIAISLVWRYMFNTKFGMVNQLLAFLSLPEIQWFSSAVPAFSMIILFIIWQASGYCILILTVGIGNIPRMYFEVSEIEGASFGQRIRYIIMPLISPTVFFLVITSTIRLFKIFDPIYIITNGGPLDRTRSIMFSAYSEIGALRIGSASAVSWILFVLILIVTALQSRGRKRWVNYDM